MRELTVSETDQTAGGLWPIVVALVGSYVGQLMVDAMGGADGIDEGVSEVFHLFTTGTTKAYREFCEKYPEAEC